MRKPLYAPPLVRCSALCGRRCTSSAVSRKFDNLSSQRNPLAALMRYKGCRNLSCEFEVVIAREMRVVQVRVEMDARTATCDTLARNMDAAHLETEQLLAQQVVVATLP